MEWSPRQTAAVLLIDAELRAEDRREQLAIQTMAARGDPKAIQKALKDDP